MSDLPSSWVQCTIGEVCGVVGGGTPPSRDPLNFTDEGGTPWVTPADLSGYREKHIARGRRNLTAKGLANSSAKVMPRGTVLFSSRAPVGYVAIAANAMSTNQGFKSFLVPPGFDSSYLYYYLRHIKREAEARATGTTFKELSGSAAARLPLVVAPSREQVRIAAKLDPIMAQIAACSDRLNRVPQILKKFRDAVLEAAVSGKLTEEWREGERLDVPWKEATFGSVGIVSGGLTKNPKRATLRFRRPYLRVANVHANRLDLEDVATIGMTEEEWEKTRLQFGDVLIVEGNGSLDQIGRAARWGNELPEASHQNHLIRWRTLGAVDSRFGLLWLLSPVGRTALMDLASTSAGLYTLSISKVSRLPIRAPSQQEQAEIIRRVHQLFSLADTLERRCVDAVSWFDKLAPAILTRAFRGELVPQDPDDEPAEKLLARIRAARKFTTGRAIAPTVGRWISKSTDRHRDLRPIRRSRSRVTMTKSRTDSDVKGQPYLAEILRAHGKAASAQDLFVLADLPIQDFYKQLLWEVDAGYIKDCRKSLEAA